MKTIDKLCTVWMGRHLEYMRHRKGLSAAEMARRIGMAHVGSYRHRELGRVQITLSFLLRVQLALEVHIEYLWFPFRMGEDSPEEAVIEAAMADLLELMCPVTVEQVLEAAAEAFQVPVHAVKSGLGHKKVNRVRTAAALVVESIPHLKLTDLANLVRRTPRHLLWSRRQAQQKEGKLFWSKVATIREEVEKP